jgi:putative nucleotidyltransferase with HDIG domain
LDLFFQLLSRLEALLPDVYRHSLGTAKLALKLGRYLGLEIAAVENLVTAALLHDVGKLKISPAILYKPGKLEAEEWEEIVKHPRYGVDMLAELNPSAPFFEGILYHHEWWSGEGYYGLQGTAIPWPARFLALCDSWDAMTSPRVYQPTKTPQEAEHELERMRGRQFDPELVPAFLQLMREERSRSTAERLEEERRWLQGLFRTYRDFHHAVVYVESLCLDDLVLRNAAARCAGNTEGLKAAERSSNGRAPVGSPSTPPQAAAGKAVADSASGQFRPNSPPSTTSAPAVPPLASEDDGQKTVPHL